MIVTAATNDNKYIDIYDTRANNFNYSDGVYVTAKSAVENSGLHVYVYMMGFNCTGSKVYGISMNSTICDSDFVPEGDELNYSNFVRFYLIASLMKEYPQTKGFIWLDADTIVRKDLQSMIDFPDTDKCILRIQEREDEVDGKLYNNGVFAINNSPQSITYLKGVYEACNEEGNWLSGQRQMFYLAKERNIMVEPFDWRYNDSGFRKKSFIWHSKGKFYNEQWQSAFKYYLGDK